MSFMRKILDAFKLVGTNDISISDAYAEIERANKLAEIANKTTNREEFYNSIEEIEDILTELSKHEHKFDFSYPPSANLNDLRRIKGKQIELLEKRIKEKENTQSLNKQTETSGVDNFDKLEEKETETQNISMTSDTLVEEPKTEIVNNYIEDFGNNEISGEIAKMEESIALEDDNCEIFIDEPKEENIPYKSSRLIIKGLHLYFIDIAREIVSEKAINVIPLMREYHLTENDLNQIIGEIQEAKILDINRDVTMSIDELEKFIDIYEPSIFDCAHSIFDKEIFMVMGEIVFDKGVEDTYNTLPADEVIDYLNIMEKLKIISYDNYRNNYTILVSKTEFYKICECIPNSFSNTNYEDLQIDYSKANFDNMSGIEFEKYCAYILSQNEFTEIKITPASGDHGIDILAEKDGITYAIQCKCYSSDIGNAAIQQAHTGKSIYHKDIAVVLTNRYFTSQAKEEAQALGVKLWDRDKLSSMIEEI